MTRLLCVLFCLLGSCFAQQLPPDDEVRIAEGFRLARQIEDRLWPGWSQAPFSVLLVTRGGEFLIGHPNMPAGFTRIGRSEELSSDVFFRGARFNSGFQATFPPFPDGIPVIVIGEPQNTEAKSSTPWVITFLHEHFHQLQYSQPDYGENVTQLGLSKNDKTGMWMLNYPFPYRSAKVVAGFRQMKAKLLAALQEKNEKLFRSKARVFIAERKRFLTGLSEDDRKYFGFQVWQEGLARYTQIKSAEAAASYQPTGEFKNLADYESFSSYARRARMDTEKELGHADMAKWQRVVFYSYGACEGLLLDRLNPGWQARYFSNRFSTDAYFPDLTSHSRPKVTHPN